MALASYSRAVQNVVAASKVWAFVEHRHPWLVYSDIDWDKAWLEAAPDIIAAENDDALAVAVGRMLSALNDPSSRVLPAEAAGSAAGKALSWPQSGVLLVNLELVSEAKQAQLRSELAKATSVVVDARRVSRRSQATRLLDAVSEYVTKEPMSVGATRAVQHWGYAPNDPRFAIYHRLLETTAPTIVKPVKDSKVARVVFILDPSWIPNQAIALKKAKLAAFVSTGPVDASRAGWTKKLELGSREVELRMNELILDGQLPIPTADVVAPRDPVKAAVNLAGRKRMKIAPPRAATAPEPKVRITRKHETEGLPGPGHRTLAAVRFWNILDLYYGYPDLLESWDARLPEFVDGLLAADDEASYAKALLRMAARVPDAHSNVWGGAVGTFTGNAWAPFEARVVQGALVVVDAGKGADGPRVGDVIHAIDGKPVAQAFAERADLVAASTPAAHRNRVAWKLMSGALEAKLELIVSGADGVRRKVSVARTRAFSEDPAANYRLIDKDVGYADLDELEQAEVGPMFEAFANTKALILDIRGYPKGTAWVIAPRLNKHPEPTPAARFRTPLVVGDNPWERRIESFQNLPPYDGEPYNGEVVVLIDDRAISQSEHTCLFLAAATKVTFIGTRTTGSNGNVTDFCLPGGVCGMLTGMEVRHVDGRQLQRVGIVPDIEVEPTLAGIRAGKDEVLERALKYLRSRTNK